MTCSKPKKKPTPELGEDYRNHTVHFPGWLFSEGPSCLTLFCSERANHRFSQRGRSVQWLFSWCHGFKTLQNVCIWLKTKMSSASHRTQNPALERPWTKCSPEGKQWQILNLRLFLYHIPKCQFKVDKLEIRTYRIFNKLVCHGVLKAFLNRELNAFLENM